MKSDFAYYAQLSIEESLNYLESNQQIGLNHAQIQPRLIKYGYNELPKPSSKSILNIFFGQFKNALVWLLILAIIVSLLLHHREDSIFIAIVLIINAVVGSWQEYKATKIIADLSKMATPKAKVRRDGQIINLDSKQLVPGDILIIEPGSKISADARLIIAHDLAVDESILTGESIPNDKQALVIKKGSPLNKTDNCVFMGTTVTRGRGEAMVFNTGSQTQSGRIAHHLNEAEPPKTPLETQIIKFTQYALIGILLLILVIFLIGILANNNVADMFLSSVTLAVAAIPEGLPIFVTIILAFGVSKMATEKTLVRQQNAIETLGQIQVLLTDKTGTLTENKLTVASICLATKDSYTILKREDISPFMVGLSKVLIAGWLCNDAELNNHNTQPSIFDPVDQAILEFVTKLHPNQKLQLQYPLIFELPFNSTDKYMATFHQKGPRNTIIYIKGAPESVIKLCSHVSTPHKIKRFDHLERKKFLHKLSEPAQRGEKLIATAEIMLPTQVIERANFKHQAMKKLISQGATLTGVLTLADTLRKEAVNTIKSAAQAGVKVMMVTGDNQAVAYSIGKQLDLPENDIIAEVIPAQKLNLVHSLQQKGLVVAMTGDGINDSPALKQADVGLAMGQRGDDIAKDAADILILDDNIATIVKAIESGRTIFRNIQRVIAHLLATNLSEILVLLVPIVSGNLIPLPFLPTQILWVNLITDSFTVIPLALEPNHTDVMQHPPRSRTDPLLTKKFWHNIIFVTTIITIITLGSFLYIWNTTHDLVLARSMTFTILALAQVFNLLNARSVKTPFFKLGWLSNPAVIFALFGSILLQISIFYIPITREYLSLAILPTSYMLVAILVSSLVFWPLEIKKYLASRQS